MSNYFSKKLNSSTTTLVLCHSLNRNSSILCSTQPSHTGGHRSLFTYPLYAYVQLSLFAKIKLLILPFIRRCHALDLRFQIKKMDNLVLVSSNKVFGGYQKVYSHESSELKCKMNFSVYLPPQAEGGDSKLPVIYYLSGLTCTEQNFISKSGFQRFAAEHGIIVIGPDTSPRGVKIPGDDESWDFGVSAGFYLDAENDPWSNNYRMGSYLNKELYELVLQAFSNVVDSNRIGILGHSMGGHGALVSTLRNPGLYKSVSAFAPICNPVACPWGEKAFNGYLGADKSKWSEWDATELVKKYNGPPLTLFIDQGAADKFYIEKQLLPENLVQACRSAGVPVILNLRDGYDHSYYYISTFIGEHFDFHAKILKA